MLKQFADLTIEADGRYAEDYELKFLEDYLESQDLRMSAYVKIKDNAEAILEAVRVAKNKRNSEFKDYYGTCKRDLNDLIRYCAAALLFDDMERLRTNMLLWFQTIAKSWTFEDDNNDTYDVLLQVIPQFLTPEEAKFALPVFELNCAVLA
jgi:Phycobilisome protein